MSVTGGTGARVEDACLGRVARTKFKFTSNSNIMAALEAKEKGEYSEQILMFQRAHGVGNASFRAGDWPQAIGHYSTAIFADRSDPTYPLNRAAAYLKIGK